MQGVVAQVVAQVGPAAADAHHDALAIGADEAHKQLDGRVGAAAA
jgi:hypothetical protein